MRTLLIDIENSPNLVDVWDIHKPFVGITQIHEPTRVLCFAAKWLGQPKGKTFFFSDWEDGHKSMVAAAHELLSEADVVEHYYGERFDVPKLNGEFLMQGLGPPAPFQQIDLYKTVKQRFAFPSNKLDYVTRALGFEGKVSHGGHVLWRGVMAGDPKAQKLARRYNIQDVQCLEDLHWRLLPWITAIPSEAVYADHPDSCPFCGSSQVQRRGFAYTGQGKYQRYQCQACGGWHRSVKRVSGANVRPVAS